MGFENDGRWMKDQDQRSLKGRGCLGAAAPDYLNTY